MGSTHNPTTGDWLQHEAFVSRRGDGGWKSKLAEVAWTNTSFVNLYLAGEPGLIVLTRAEIIRWWNLFEPPPTLHDVNAPPWVKANTKFTTRSQDPTDCYEASILTVKGAWVSYIEDCIEYTNVLRIVPYSEFMGMGWVVTAGRPSVWTWLRQPLV